MGDTTPDGFIVAEEGEEPEDTKEWAVKLDGRDEPVRINDLPYKVTREIAKRYQLIWAMVGEVPRGLASAEPEAAVELVTAAAAHVGADTPVVPESHGALMKFLADRFVQVDSDLPSSYKDGLPLTDAQATT